MSESPEESLFAAALERPEAERAALLEQACAGDKALRQRVEALLLAHDATANPLATVQATFQPAEVPVFPSSPEETPGQTFGRYKLLEKIGEGGCGVVYVAEQTEPVRRRVALKIIKLGMDTKSVVARFEAERQALALMDHPNIAKVLDAGTTELGRPFFVMELVRGIRITDYCDQTRLSTQHRLNLFIKVCQAIQHAHQKGIIHRDIKPSNILVTLHDGEPVPKVIDFGIAKPTEGRLTDATVYTQLHQFIGTPAYMSPEQAEMSGLDIDTRSDIYSLGVLLYEILTGQPPFDPQELMAQGLDGMRRTIREIEPARPSTRLATLSGDELTATAQRRSVDSAKLTLLLRGDLDWIVMKCLEKDRSRRYETANGLAADLKRHLDDEPVVARPPSAVYKLHKAIRRNRLAWASGFLIVSSLATGFTLTLIQMTRAQEEARRATIASHRAAEAEAQAERQLAESESISNFLVNVLMSPNPQRDGHSITIAETLNQAARRLDLDLSAQPKRRIAFMEVLADTYNGLGLHKEELVLRDKIFTYLLENESTEAAVVSARRKWANCLAKTGEFEEANRVQKALLNEAKRVDGPAGPITIRLMRDLGISYRETGQYNAAIVILEQALEALKESKSTDETLHIAILNSLATSYGLVKRLEESESMFRTSLEISQRIYGATYPDTLVIMNNLATTLEQLHRGTEATELFLAASRNSRARNGPAHPATLKLTNNAISRHLREGRLAEAEALLDELLPEIRKIVPEKRHELDSIVQEIAGSWLTLAAQHAWSLNHTRFQSICRKALYSLASTEDPVVAERISKASLLDPQLDHETQSLALSLSERAVNLGANHPYLPYFQLCLGMALYRNGKFAEAESILRKADESSTGFFGVRPMSRSFLSLTQSRQGRTEEAKATLESISDSIGNPRRPPTSQEPTGTPEMTDQLMIWMAGMEARSMVNPNQKPSL